MLDRKVVRSYVSKACRAAAVVCLAIPFGLLAVGCDGEFSSSLDFGNPDIVIQTGDTTVNVDTGTDQTQGVDVGGTVEPVGCRSDVECDDGFDCTVDMCDRNTRQCVHEPHDLRCDDGLLCNGAEICDVVFGCQAGEPMDCDDGNPCTVDTCDESGPIISILDLCVHEPDDALCDDGLFCNGDETCDAELACQPGTPIDCDDGIACTVDTCDEAAGGTCDYTPDDTLCDDGDACTDDTCDADNNCGYTPVDCGQDVCDPDSGDCVDCVNDEDCDEREVCAERVCEIGGGKLVVGWGTTVTALTLPGQTVRWSTDVGSAVNSLQVVPDHGRSVVLAIGTDTTGIDGTTGAVLWTSTGVPASMTIDVYRQMYTEAIRYPHGAPNIGGGPAPDILVSLPGDPCSTTWLLDSRTGAEIWSRTDCDYPVRVSACQVYPTSSGSYDVMFRSGPLFSTTAGELFRVDGATGADPVIWSRQFSNRSGIPIPDINGDGEYDFFAEPSYWSNTVLMLDGATGDTVWSVGYGSFDLPATPQVVPSVDGDGYDVIACAQNSSGGAVRRYHGADGTVMWDSPHPSRYALIHGLLRRGDDLTVLASWEHQHQAFALDAADGHVLWSADIPLDYASWPGIGIQDMTGDGNDDFLALTPGMWLRLYDGVTGVEQTWFAAIAVSGGSAVAYDSVP